MITLSVGDLKAHFSHIIKKVQNGEEIAIAYGKKKEIVAIIVPTDHYYKRKKRQIGIFEGKASFSMSSDFKISTSDFLNS